MMTFERWSPMWSRLGAGSQGETVFQELIQAYSEPHRRYHTLTHLQDCLQQFDAACSLAMHPAEVEVALWFHDAIYDPRSSENEARSAQWAQDALRDASASAEIVQRVAGKTAADASIASSIRLQAALHPTQCGELSSLTGATRHL